MGMENYSLSDIKAVTDGQDGQMGTAWYLILLFILFNRGFFGVGNVGEAVATNADIQRGFDTNTIINKLDGITNGICDSTYALNNSISNIGSQMQQCCCETQKEILASRYMMDKGFCDVANAIHAEGEATRGLITQNEIQKLRDELQSANLVLAQGQQTDYILDKLGRYVCGNNYNVYGYGCGCGC